MRRAYGFPLLLVLALACSLAARSAPGTRTADALVASPDAPVASPVVSPPISASPIVASPISASPVAGPVCARPPGVSQDGQLRDPRTRTTRQAFLTSSAHGADVGFRLEAGRICIEPGVVVPDPAFDCPPAGSGLPCAYAGVGNDYVHYDLAATLYLESGRLVVTVRSGTVIFYTVPSASTPSDGGTYRPSAIRPGQVVELRVGDSVFIEDADVRIENPDASHPATIFATGYYPVQGAPGCAGQNCWIPS